MFGLQPSDLIGIAVVALLLFGPSRLPELARSMGKGMREFQSAIKDVDSSSTPEVRKSVMTKEEPEKNPELTTKN